MAQQYGVDIVAKVLGGASVQKLNKELAGTATNSIRATNGIKKVGRASAAASTGVKKLTAALAPLLTAYAVFQAGKFVIFKAAQLETQTRSLKVLTGSLKTAKGVIKELQAFGAVTPFTSTELIDTAKRLAAFGVDTEKLVATTKRLGDVAGATGADLKGIATAYGQIQAKGRLQGEELLQLQERGINLQDELQKMYGLTGDEFRKALEKGRFSAEAVELALKNLTDTGGKYADGAIAQSDTLAGRFSTLQDGIGRLAATIGQVLSPAIKAILNQAISAINVINTLINQGAKIEEYGIDDQTRNKLFRQAEEEAKELALLRGGGKLDPSVFNQIKQERFSDLLDQYGFNTGKIQAEISPVTEDIKIPELLGGTGGGTGGGKGGGKAAAAAAKAEKDRLDLLEKQATAYGDIRQRLERTFALEGDVTDLQRKKLQNLFKQEDALERIFSDVAAADQAELVALTEKVRLQADLNDLKDAADDFAKNFADAAKLDKELNEELTETQQLATDIGEQLSNGITDALIGAINGTKSLGEAFQELASDILAAIGKALILKAVTAAIGSVGSGGAGGTGLMGLLGFAEGGFVTGPTPALVGEGGQPEYIIPASKMDGAMQRYSAGATGKDVIDGPSPRGGGADVAEAPASINISGGVMQFGGDDYIRKDQLPAIIDQSSKMGEARTLRKLQMNPGARRKIGL